MSKKVCIFVPHKKNGGFFDENVVTELEDYLNSDEQIDFVGNIDIEKCMVIDGHVLYDGIDIAEVNLFFWYAKNMHEYKDILFAISARTRVIKDPQTLGLITDKYKAHTKLKSHGFNVSQYALVGYDDHDAMKKILNDWKTILVKPRMGSYGRGIIKIDDFDTFRDVAGILEMQAHKRRIFIERFYPHDIEDWISVVVVNFSVVYGYRKNKEKFKNWKVYDLTKKGGDAVEADTEPVRDIAEKAAQTLNERIICFDMIKVGSEYKIIDENNFPGLYPEILQKHKCTIADVFMSVIKESL